MAEQTQDRNRKRFKRSISRKALTYILLTALLLSATGIIISYKVYSDTMDQHYIDNTVKLARTAVAVVDAAAVERCSSEVYRIYRTLTPEELSDENAAYLEKFSFLEEDPDWQALRSTLQIIGKENDLTSLLIVALDRDANSIIYVVDSDDTETYCPPGTVDPTMTDEEIDHFLSSTAVISNTEEFGWLTSGAAPICGADGSLTGLLIIDVSMNEVMQDRYAFLRNYCLILLLVTAALAAIMTWNMRRQIAVPINQLAKAAEEYSVDRAHYTEDSVPARNHFSELNIHTGDEVENLSKVMSDMETQLAEYIENLKRVTAEKERIGAELSIATQIQADMLPRIFPPFPDRREFDLYASMTPAKEVGGDFYDFFLIDDDHLGLVMADVSGKGVPAALFMVIAKTLIKNRALLGESPAEILNHVNAQLCEGNEAQLFVTVWLAVIEISTGKGVAANAGHEHPAIRRADGKFELAVYRHSPAVAMFDSVCFREHPFALQKGDSLFVYTDGVPEATDSQNQMFGTDRMLAALNRDPFASADALLHRVREDINAFVGDAPQFDDITMMCFRYFGPDGNAKERTFDADTKNLDEVLALVDGELESLGCPPEIRMKIDVAVEEIFVNIASYAYAPGKGSATVRVSTQQDPKRAVITFTDRGIPYDPLQKPDPDLSVPLEDRAIGGLGIYITKKTMDDIRYEYRDGQNVLTIGKNIEA